MLQVSSLKKSFGGRTLFEDVSFTVAKGERLGLVGRNGSGKSTLMKMLINQEAYDSGQVAVPRGYRLGYLDQHIHFTKGTVLEECCQVLSEEEQYDYYKAEKLLFGLGFDQEDLYRPPTDFSGGYQLRINLVKLLLTRPDMLLLDEPTNYLDIVSVRWLERFLKEFPGEAMIVTHDRSFMDSVVTHTIGIHRGKTKKVKGPTLKYYEQLLLDEEVYERTRQRQEKKVKHMEDFVARFRAKASKATQAQSKLKQIEKIRPDEALKDEATLGFRFRYKPCPAKTIGRVNGVSFSYEPGVTPLLFENLDFEIKANDRIAIIGKNGKGKSTLLSVLSGENPCTSGNVVYHDDIETGYYQQTHSKDLSPENTIAEEISNANSELGLSEVMGICGSMMFSGDDAKKKIRVLSGGEQGRVLLGKILAHPANLLLLDEPSNHLDMESIEAMIEQVEEFPGALVIVTHNEDILRRLAQRLVIFHKGRAEFFDGDYEEFLEKIGWEEEGAPPSKKAKDSSKKEKTGDSGDRGREERTLKKKIEELESQIVSLETQLEDLNREAIELATRRSSAESLADLAKNISRTQMEIDVSYETLDRLARQLEDLS